MVLFRVWKSVRWQVVLLHPAHPMCRMRVNFNKSKLLTVALISVKVNFQGMAVFWKPCDLFIYLFLFAASLDMNYCWLWGLQRKHSLHLLHPSSSPLQRAPAECPPGGNILLTYGREMGETFFHGDFTSNTVHQKMSERQAGDLRSVFIRSLLGGKTHLFHHGRRH